MIKILTLVLLLFAGNGQSKETQKPSKTYTRLMTLEKSTMRFIGSIKRSNIDSIIDFINNNPAIKTLVITSGGGEVSSNIRLAYLINQKNIAIEVIDFCMSSCFNYLFIAAKHKTIHPGAFLGFHGAATTSVPFVARAVPFIRRVVKEEREFVKYLNLDKKLFKKLHKKANKLTKKIKPEPGMYAVGPKFFKANNIKIDSPWFPQSQKELNQIIEQSNERIIERRKKPHKPWIVIGDFS